MRLFVFAIVLGMGSSLSARARAGGAGQTWMQCGTTETNCAVHRVPSLGS